MMGTFNEALDIFGRIAIRDYIKSTEDKDISWENFNSSGANTVGLSEDDFLEAIKIFKGDDFKISKISTPDAKEEPKEEPKEEVKIEPKVEPKVEEPVESQPEDNEPETAEDNIFTPTDEELEKELDKDMESCDPEVDLGNNIHRGEYRIAKNQWPHVYEALIRCQKRMGGEFTFAIMGEDVVEQKQLYTGNPYTNQPHRVFWGNPLHIPVYIVKIVSRVKENNWEVVAICQHEKSQKGIIITPINEDHQVPAEFYSKQNIQCDHCHTNRDRIFGAIVYNNASKEYRMVGKACLKEYTGIDPTDLLALSHVYSVARHWDPQNVSGKNYYDLMDALVIASAAIKVYGYVKAEYQGRGRWGEGIYYEDDTCTRRIVRYILKHSFEDPKAFSDPQAKRVAEYVENHYDDLADFATKAKDYMGSLDNLVDDFKHNVQVVLSGYLVTEKQLGLVCSFPQIYGRFVTGEENKKAMKDNNIVRNNLYYPGEEGDVVTITNINKLVKGGQTRTGNWIVTVYTNDGYELTVFLPESKLPADLNTVVKIIGKIYRFNEFRGNKSTTLTNVIFYTEEDAYFNNQRAQAPVLGQVKDKITFTCKKAEAGPEKSASFSWNSITYYATITMTDTNNNILNWNCSNPDIYTNPEQLVGKQITGTIKDVNKDVEGIITSYYIGGRVKVSESTQLNNKNKLIESSLEDIINASLEDDTDLQALWQEAATKYEKLWTSKESCMEDCSIIEGIRKVTPHYAELSSETEDGNVKSALGMTSHVRCIGHPIEVSISTLTFDMGDLEFYNVVLHEMAHVAAFYTDRSLDHGDTWKYYVDKLNNCGYSIIPDADDEDFAKMFDMTESKLQECHFSELPGHRKNTMLEKEFDTAINNILEKIRKEESEKTLTPEEEEALQAQAYQDQLDYEACLDMYTYDEDGFCDGFPR